MENAIQNKIEDRKKQTNNAMHLSNERAYKDMRNFNLNESTEKDFVANPQNYFYKYVDINKIPFVIYLMENEQYDIMLRILVSKYNLKNIVIAESDICDLLFLFHQSRASPVNYSDNELEYIITANTATLSAIDSLNGRILKGVNVSRGILLYKILTGHSMWVDGYYDDKHSNVKDKALYEHVTHFTSPKIVELLVESRRTTYPYPVASLQSMYTPPYLHVAIGMERGDIGYE